MVSFDTQSLHKLNDDELTRLVSIVSEQFGADLRRRQFNDTALAMFEDIPGLDTIPVKTARKYLDVLWSKYLQSYNTNPAG